MKFWLCDLLRSWDGSFALCVPVLCTSISSVIEHHEDTVGGLR